MRDRERPLVCRTALNTARILVVSDIHGDLALLRQILDKLDYRPGEDGLVLLGDYVNRGTESLNTVREVMALCRQPNVFALRGNNDVFLLRGDLEDIFSHLQHYGDRCLEGEIVRDAGAKPPESPEEVPAFCERCYAAFPEELGFLYGLPDILETERFLFAHAGLESEDLEAQSLDYVLSAPRFHQTGRHCFHKLLLVGHWPTANYFTDRLCNAPAYNARTNTLSIDGGNRIKQIGQVNGVVLDNRSGGWTWNSADFLPEIAAPIDQPEAPGQMIAWPDDRVEVLERGEKLSLCRSMVSGAVMPAPTAFLYTRSDGLHAGDVTDKRLAITRGEPLGVLADLGDMLLVRRRGEIGQLVLREPIRIL